MSEDKREQVRRRLLKSIAVGSGVAVSEKTLFRNWTTPVVESVVLPAHAQTSGPAPGILAFSGSLAVPFFPSLFDEDDYRGLAMTEDNFGDTLADALLPAAEAKGNLPGIDWAASIQRAGDSLWTVNVTRRRLVPVRGIIVPGPDCDSPLEDLCGIGPVTGGGELRNCVRELYWRFQLTVQPHPQCDTDCNMYGSGRFEGKQADRACGFPPGKSPLKRCAVRIRCLSDPNFPVPGESGCRSFTPVLMVRHIDSRGEPFGIQLTPGAPIGFGNCGGNPCRPPQDPV